MGTAGRADHPICRPGAWLCAPREAGAPENPLPHHPHRAPGRHHRRAPSTFWLEGLCHQCGAKAAVFADRKSTRLNSSHANISYAVFCLKKKKKTKYLMRTPET